MRRRFPMPEIKFTRRAIEAAAGPSGTASAVKYTFEGVTNLRMIVSRNGNRRFYSRLGSATEKPLGLYDDFPDLETLKELHGAVQRGEQTPAKAAKVARENAETETVEYWAARYFKTRDSKKDTHHFRSEQSTVNVHLLPHFKKRRVQDVRHDEILEVINELIADGRPGAAANFYVTSRRVFELARKSLKGRVTFENPFADVPKPTTKDRTRTATDDELRRIWPHLVARIASRQTRSPASAIWLAFTTGQRRDEVAKITRAELSADLSTWTIPAARTKRAKLAKRHTPGDHVVPLSDGAAAIIKHALKHLPADATGLFPGRGENETISGHGAYQAFSDICELEGIEGLTFHDIRRTVATRLGKLGFTDEDIDGLQNHAKQGVVARYNTDNREGVRREMVERLNAHLCEVLGVKTLTAVKPKTDTGVKTGRAKAAKDRG